MTTYKKVHGHRSFTTFGNDEFFEILKESPSAAMIFVLMQSMPENKTFKVNYFYKVFCDKDKVGSLSKAALREGLAVLKELGYTRIKCIKDEKGGFKGSFYEFTGEKDYFKSDNPETGDVDFRGVRKSDDPKIKDRIIKEDLIKTNKNSIIKEDNNNSLYKESKILNCKSESETTDATHTKEKKLPLQLNKIAGIKDFEQIGEVSESDKEQMKQRLINELGLEKGIKLTPEEMNDPKNKLLKYVEAPNELYCTVMTKSAYFDEACGFYLSKDALIDTGLVGYNVQAFGNFARDYKEVNETEEQCKARLIEHFFMYDNVIGVFFESISKLHNNFFVFLKHYRFNAHKYYDTNKNVHLNEAAIKAFKDFYKKYENDKKRPYDAELDLFVSKAYTNYKSRDEEYRKNTDFDSFALLFIEKVLTPALKEMHRKVSKAEYLQEMRTFLANKDSNGFSKFLPKTNPS